MNQTKDSLISPIIVLLVCTGIAVLVFYLLNLYLTNKEKTIVYTDSPFVSGTGFQKFTTENEFRKYVENNYNSTFYGRGGVSLTDNVKGTPALELASDLSQSVNRVSSTNNQVIGIDEPDIVKVNNKNIFLAKNEYYYQPQPTVFEKISGGYPYYYQQNPETKILNLLPVDKITELANISDQGNLLLDQNILVIMNQSSTTGYDVSDTTNPKKLWKYVYENNISYNGARMFDGKLYLILQTSLNNYSPCVTPLMREDVTNSVLSVRCLDYIYPAGSTSGNQSLNILKINPDNGQVEYKNSILMNNDYYGTIFYMSPNAIYLTHQVEIDNLKVTIDFLSQNVRGLIPQNVIDKLVTVTKLDISQQAKEVEFNQILNNYMNSLDRDTSSKLSSDIQNKLQSYANSNMKNLQQFSIAKLSNADLSVVAESKLPGQLLNQYSLDEYEGNLRIATTIGANGLAVANSYVNTDSFSEMYVLDSNLKPLGLVSDLGKTEKIYSVRFIGNKAYLVTFRQVDPFYVIDLSDTANPKVAGELKIPGYSGYLHELEKNLILGVGVENSRLKVSMFDVSNPANPIEKAKYISDSYGSEVLYNPHAFLLDKENKIFVIPGSNGAYIFTYTADSIDLKKVVAGNDNYTYWSNAKRAIYVNNYIYVITDTKLIIVSEDTFEKVSEYDLTTSGTSNGQMCGGIAVIQCPDGYYCKYDGTYPDASGVCMKN